MMDEDDINHRGRLLASMLCQTAEKAAMMLDLDAPQTAEAFAMALVSYVAGTAIKGKEAEAVRTMAGIVGNYETQIAQAAMLHHAETGTPN
ncbi:hypothetical protein UFOVP233_30 [uncultured Caudovirales phage]|uniref:Uncharacterized protein n=1 Tax=uncultured Caudovirales phage TaxID=2100421 RepID=A0A6J7WTW3_9CAUD|nr:hypothetical protein UFOVP233_30 [uncultured Caudovirales phage]